MSEERDFRPSDNEAHAAALELEALGLLEFLPGCLMRLTDAGSDRAVDLLLAMPMTTRLLVSFFAAQELHECISETEEEE